MREIHLKGCLTDKQADSLKGTFLEDSHADMILTESADVYKPDGSPLLKLRKNAIPVDLYHECLPALREAATWTNNRGYASGLEAQDGGGYTPVRSGIIGSWDRDGGRTPYCRLTAFNLHNSKLFDTVRPLITAIDEQFMELMPDRHQAQMEYVRKTHDDYTINGTAFTTVTVNKNFQTSVHKDAGDLKAGFGVMSAWTSDNYDGGYTIFPKYGVGYDLRKGDVVMADVHEWHGNSGIRRHRGTGSMERISLVFYYRERMLECGSHREEAERAKNLYGKIEH